MRQQSAGALSGWCRTINNKKKQCNNEKFTKNKFVGHAVSYGRSMHPATD